MIHISPGEKFGHLTVIESNIPIQRGTHKRRGCLCNCDCGKTYVVDNTSLVSGHTKSCGCARGETAKNNSMAHGFSGTRLYRIWSKMKERCYDERQPYYNYYGGKGITICDEWLNDFLKFREWALSNGYSDDLSIDRINGNEGYNPNNCRWATKEEQQNNISWNRNLTLNGKTQSMSRWSRELNIPVSTLYNRIISGWDDEKILTYPIDKRKATKRKRCLA